MKLLGNKFLTLEKKLMKNQTKTNFSKTERRNLKSKTNLTEVEYKKSKII